MATTEQTIEKLRAELIELRARITATYNRLMDELARAEIGLTGEIGDHEHPEYVHVGVAKVITAVHTFAPDAAGAPFVLGETAQGQTVAGLNANYLHTHQGAFPDDATPGSFWIVPLED